MADPDSPAGSLRCTVCGFENGSEATYCQDCGAKLERPPEPPAAPKSPALSPPRVSSQAGDEDQVSAPPAGKPVPKPAAKRRKPIPIGAVVGTIIRTVIYAALAAVVIQVFRKPAGMPPPAPRFENPAVVETVRRDLRAAVDTKRTFHAPWDSVNSYLATVLRPGEDAGAKSIPFKRAAVAPRGEDFTLYVEGHVFGIPIYPSITYKPVSRGGGTGLNATGAAVGRIPLPIWSAGIVESMIDGLDASLFSELENLRNARNVEIGPDAARISYSSK